MTEMTAPHDYAILTKSYAGDFELCRALCASIDRLMPDVTHYLVIDRADTDLFGSLAGPRRILLETEHYLPELFATRLMGRRLWIAPYGPPMRGWVYQQLAKLAVTATLPEKAIVLVDSDVVFVRPLDPDALIRNGRVRLWRAPGASDGPKHWPWHRSTASLLGLPRRSYFGADYITNCATWHPAVVRALLAHIRRVTWLPWRVALSWRLHLSEFILYGVFVEHVKGPHQEMIFTDEQEICHCSWHFNCRQADGLAAFANSLEPAHVAVLLQSNLGLGQHDREAVFATLASQAQTGTAP